MLGSRLGRTVDDLLFTPFILDFQTADVDIHLLCHRGNLFGVEVYKTFHGAKIKIPFAILESGVLIKLAGD